MPRRRLAWNSVRWRAAFLTSALVTVAMTAFIAFTLRQVSTDVRARAMERSAVASSLLATQVGQSSQQGLRQIQDTAGNAELRAFLETPTDAARQHAGALLERLASRGRQVAALWDAQGHRVLTASAPSAAPAEAGSEPAPTEPGLAALHERDGHVYMRSVAAVSGPVPTSVIGYLVLSRAIEAGSSSTLIGGMVGQNARTFIGNQAGDVWTDLERPVTLSSMDLAAARAQEFSGPGGEPMIGAPVKIPGTPWVLVVALPRAAVMAPVWRLFRDLSAAGVVFVLLATFGAAVLSARVTQPLEDLTGAAQAIAAGDYAQRVRASGQEEVARLAGAFNAMAAQVEQSRADLEARARELSMSREEARRANAAKDDFLAVLSHELRTPLNAMLGWSQLLRAGTLSPERVHHALEVIERNARVQVRLVDDLLDVSRIVVGRFSLEFHPLDVAAVVQSAVESIQPAAAEKGVRVQATLAPDARMTRGDAGRLQQAVGNLLSNALKFTPSGGRIDVSLAADGDGLAIAVRDTGDGIAADALPLVFDRLLQADGHAARRHSGLGLGLAIVRQVVELHGGTVTAASDGKGAGATFRIWLPRTSTGARTPPAEARAVAGGTGASIEHTSIRGVRCLVVDDSEDAREMVATLLSTRGANVTSVGSAAAALDVLDRDLPDVILSDLAMPGESGFDLIGRIRSRPAAQGGGIPAVALTAYTTPEDRQRSMQCGFDEHLVKPVDAVELIDTVARLRRRA